MRWLPIPVPQRAPAESTSADGNPHQVVIVYNGPNDSPANYLYVYLDPAFNPGTHTPVAGSVPIFSGPFDITQHINLKNGTAYYRLHRCDTEHAMSSMR